MRSFKLCLLSVILGTILLVSESLTQSAEFTAKSVTVFPRSKMTGKVYLKGNKVRSEFQEFGLDTIRILRPDKKVMWIISPMNKSYMEFSLGGP